MTRGGFSGQGTKQILLCLSTAGCSPLDPSLGTDYTNIRHSRASLMTWDCLGQQGWESYQSAAIGSGIRRTRKFE